MSVGIKVNTKEVQRVFQLAPKELKYELKDALLEIKSSFLKKFALERLQGPPGIYGRGHKWSKGRGIYNTFIGKVYKSDNIDNMRLEIRTDSNIAGLHERGGTVTAKGGKLAVPFSRKLRPEMYSAGGRLKARFRKPGQLKKVGPIESQGKQLLVQFYKSGKLKILYILKQSIIIKPRLGFYRTWELHRSVHPEKINKHVQKALNRATNKA